MVNTESSGGLSEYRKGCGISKLLNLLFV